MGGAQPLAVTMNGGVVIAIDVDKRSIDRRIEKRYCDMYTESLEEALTVANEYKEKKEPISIGLLGNAAEILPELVKRNITPDLVTDQTSAHDPLNGYIPVGYTLEEAAKLREEDPERYVQLSKESMTKHVEAMLAMQAKGAITFDYGNNIRQVAFDEGLKNAFDFLDSFQHLSVHYSAKEKDHSAG